MRSYYPEDENDYNYALKQRRPRSTASDPIGRTVNTLATPDNIRSTGSTRITSKGREAAMEQLRNSRPSILQRVKAEADQEVNNEIDARRRVDETVLKTLRSDEAPLKEEEKPQQ